MLTDLTNIPADLTQETSLNGKYLKGIPTAVTNPDVDIGNPTHSHASDGDHGHAATVPSHTHSGTHSGAPSADSAGAPSSVASAGHTHAMSSSSQEVAEADNDGNHTHNAFTNDIVHRTITFYKKTNISTPMSRKSLPRKMTFFYSKTGTLDGLAALSDYIDKHIKGNATPETNAGSNNHQHDVDIHNHPAKISDHSHTFSFGGAVGEARLGSGFFCNFTGVGHSHPADNAGTVNTTSDTPTSGDSAGHQHDDITHEPAFKTLQLLQVNSVKMSNVGVPKNCILLWLDTIALLNLVPGWQVSDGTNDTIDMLDIYPKGSATPDTIGGNTTHTHDEDTVSHSHTGADAGHTHDPFGSVGEVVGSGQCNSVSQDGAPTHSHSVSSVGAQATQTVTITNGASNHDHGSISNDPDSKTVAFIERVN